MELPPGPLYVIGVASRALPASVAAYGILRFVFGFLGVATPIWLTLIVLLVAHPIVQFWMEYWRAYKIRADAAAHGAVLVPRVLEEPTAIRDSIMRSMLSGYPGAPCIVRCRVC
jgi:hypothetical protein